MAGVSVGGLSYQDAAQRINNQASQIQAKSVSVSLEHESKTVSLVDLGVVIDHQAAVLAASRPASDWSWLTPGYWRSFFGRKNISLAANIDSTKLGNQLNSLFGLSVEPINAQLAIDNGQLKVIGGEQGKAVNPSPVEAVIGQLVSGVSVDSVTVDVVAKNPQVTNEVADRTKSEVEAALHPVKVQTNGFSYTITAADQFGLLDFQPGENSLTWSLNNQKLEGFLQNKIGNKLNTKMVQRTLDGDSSNVTSEGREGKQVDLATLSKSVISAINNRTDTEQTPVDVPVKTIAITEKRVYPDFVAGLFEGLYVDVSIKKQTMYIMNGSTKTAQYLVSTGKAGTPTPIGVFYVKNKIELARSPLYRSLWMRKWNALARSPDGSGYQGYGIHDLPCFDPGCNSVEGAAHLGRQASHGCVRLGPQDAAWFYDNIPVGTPVNIH